jgi:putative transposase
MKHRGHLLAEGEYYHIYNRGAHKKNVFEEEFDYTRFLMLLFLANSDESFEIRSLSRKFRGSQRQIFEKMKCSKSLVDIFAYALMPNHFHLIVKQKAENGVEKFMQKIGTGYAMYFNEKYAHTGVVFEASYQSKHIDSEAYFRYIFAYVHLNPLNLIDKKWKKKITDRERIRAFLTNYPYCSYRDLFVMKRPERSILTLDEEYPDFIKQNDLNDLLNWEPEYFKDE